MNPEDKRPQQDRLSDAEIARKELENKKLELEIKALEKSTRQLTFKKAMLFLWGGATVLIPALWFYVKDIYLPLSQNEYYKLLKDQSELRAELISLGEKITTKSASLDSVTALMNSKHDSLVLFRTQLVDLEDSLGSTQELLLVMNDSLAGAAARLVEQERAYLQRIESVRKDYQQLSSQHNLTERQRDAYREAAREMEAKVQSQKNVIADLNNQMKRFSDGLPNLRRQPKQRLTTHEVRTMLAKYGFYCKETTLTRSWSAPLGKGLNNKFVRRKNGLVVHDLTTGLMWQQRGSGRLNFENAQEYIDRLNRQQYAGYRDWRLPTLEEVMSLMNPSKFVGGLHLNPVFDSAQAYLWTADRLSSNAVWFVDFSAAICYSKPASDINYLRAVRTAH